MKLDDSEVLVARTSFMVTAGGKRYLVVKGQRVSVDDPAVKGRESLFHSAVSPKAIADETVNVTARKKRAGAKK